MKNNNVGTRGGRIIAPAVIRRKFRCCDCRIAGRVARHDGRVNKFCVRYKNSFAIHIKHISLLISHISTQVLNHILRRGETNFDVLFGIYTDEISSILSPTQRADMEKSLALDTTLGNQSISSHLSQVPPNYANYDSDDEKEISDNFTYVSIAYFSKLQFELRIQINT